MKKLYECNEKYAKQKLWNIRKDITLDSIWFCDYENRYGYSPYVMYQFFDGFLDYIDELMKENGQNIHEDYFFHWLPLYDNKETLWRWYCCFDEIDF